MREIFFGISIHALRGEDDLSVLVTFNKRWYFNPRPPWGGRPPRHPKYSVLSAISIHALRGEDDLPTVDFNAIEELFQSTPSVGRTTSFTT